MTRLKRIVLRLLRDEDGPTAAEYAIILALIILICFVAVAALGTRTNSMLGNPALTQTGAS